MADVQLTQEEQAQYAQILIDAKGVIDDSLKNVLENTFGSSKGFELYEITSNTKAFMLSSAISWDNNKTIGENIAHIAGDSATGIAVSALGLAAWQTIVVGYAVDNGLNLVGVDIGDITEKAYQQAQYVSNINDIETANYNNLPEEAKATMMSQGKYPGGLNWNNFLNEMVTSSEFNVSKDLNNIYYESLIRNSISSEFDETDTNTNPTTIFDLASQYNVSVSQLEAQNTWLKDRTSDSLPSVFKNSYYNTINIENNTGISYNYNYNYYTSDSNQSGSINEQYTSQTSSATAYDAINFIANYDGTINELQEIQSAINDAYENYGLSQEYYQSFNESVATYIAVNTYYSTVTTQPTGESSSYDKNAFYYFNSIDETAPSLADKTYSILNENNIGLSVENLKLLDVNNDGKVSFIKSKMYVRFYQANSKKVA